MADSLTAPCLVEKGRFVLTLGGDHSIGMGTIAGVIKVRPETGVLWIDAHPDINFPEVSSDRMRTPFMTLMTSIRYHFCH